MGFIQRLNIIPRLIPESAAIARGEYFLQTRERYELGARISDHQPSPTASALLQSVPQRSVTEPFKGYARRLGNAVTWGDCYVLELEAAAATPDAELAPMLNQQRIRYEQIVGDSEFQEYTKSAVDVASLQSQNTPESNGRLRAELYSLTERIVYYLTASAPKEAQRAWLTLATVCLMLAGMAVIFLWYIDVYATPIFHVRQFRPTESLFLVMFAGLVGGFVSVQQRLQQPTNVDPIYKRVELEASGLSLLVSPVIGMVFAVVLFVAMMGGMVASGILPQFACPTGNPDCQGHDLASFAASAQPADATSWARLALWSFAAGFLERLVPDILTRISAVATDSK